MIEIIKETRIDDNLDNLIPDKSGFMDIETTGLSHMSAAVYIIGWLEKIDGKYTLYQYMTENPAEEKTIIKIAVERLNRLDVLYTFNGQSFDIPFINSRANRYNLETLNPTKSIDMYRIIRDRGYLLDTPNLRLNTLEEYLGIYREDQLDGRDMIYQYWEFERTKDSSIMDNLLLHNEEDIIHLPHMLRYNEILDNKSQIITPDHKFWINYANVTTAGIDIRGKTTISKGYLNQGPHNINIIDNQFEFKNPVQSDKYDDKQNCLYVYRDSMELQCNYNIPSPRDVYILKLGRKVLHYNLHSLLEETIKNSL